LVGTRAEGRGAREPRRRRLDAASKRSLRVPLAPRPSSLVPLAALALAGACTSSDAVTIEEERALGAEVARQAEAQLPLLADAPTVTFVRELGAMLVQGADTSGRAYTFRVVDSDAANAFAVPGGFVFVNRGIIERADDVSELAGVMAHEIGHVVERHSVEQMSRARNANTLVGLVYLLLGRTPGAGEQVAMQVAGSAWLAKHSREAEREADRVGVAYMARAGIDPRGMPRFFEKLLEEERRSPGLVLEWFSTHPLTADRVADTDSLVRLLPPEVVERARRDLPQFRQLKARLAQLPPPPPEPRQPAP
jgi:predicted Zn-dependent protease